MKAVPAGAFQRDASPANISSVSAFFMSEKEITVDQFTAVTGLANPSTDFTGVLNGPVQMTNWYHALVFCNKLSLSEDLTPVYTIGGSTDPAAWIAANGGRVPLTSNPTWDAATANWSATGYRLPTEAEWEWAAMGARDGTTGYLKAFAGSNGSNAFSDYVWYEWTSGVTTHPVGTKAANELGLYDMSGNVSEWCWDWWADSYPNGAQTDYRGPASGTYRVVRGGGWSGSSYWCAVANRGGDDPYRRYDMRGFRVVRR
jgi:formylglycine-generating enzyme required for sulfatase activity